MTTNSAQLFVRAQQILPGGVNSPVRAFGGVGGEPIFIKSGRGAWLQDVDGREYVDYVCSWGPLILGHAHPYLIEKVQESLNRGFSFGAPTEIEVKLAEKVSECFPAMEKMRFVSSGTEAAMSAIRLARGYTGRDKIIKFAGCYHGHADSLLVSAGSGALTFGVPSSAGVPASVTEQTLVAEYNQLDQVEALFKRYGDDIACIILEPVAGNMNLVMPKPGFLQGLRELCDHYGALLIFDEVITGFRVAKGGAQAHFQVTPDLTILGKIIGGGFPAAAFGGRADIMQKLAPLGPVYQAGTLSGNPIAMTAGLATLELVSQPDFYSDLEKKTQTIAEGLSQRAEKAGIPFFTQSIGAMLGMYFTNNRTIEKESDIKACDIDAFTLFFRAMLNEGVYFAPSAFEIAFVSAAHGQPEIEKTLTAAEKVFKEMGA